MATSDTARYRANWQDEIDSASLYRTLAEAEPRAQQGEALRPPQRRDRRARQRQAEAVGALRPRPQRRDEHHGERAETGEHDAHRDLSSDDAALHRDAGERDHGQAPRDHRRPGRREAQRNRCFCRTNTTSDLGATR